MRKHYDFSEARRNPYAKRLKKQVTIRIEESTLAYFKRLAAETAKAVSSALSLWSIRRHQQVVTFLSAYGGQLESDARRTLSADQGEKGE